MPLVQTQLVVWEVCAARHIWGPKQVKCTLGTMNIWLLGGSCGSAQGIAAVV